MATRRPTSSQTANAAAGDSASLDKSQAVETSHDVAAERDSSKPDDIYQEQSRPRVILLLTSVFMSMFLVALDRTIISTV